jgi:HEAT repeat protein
MKRRQYFFALVFIATVFCFPTVAQLPVELQKVLPEADQQLRSPDLLQRIEVLDRLVTDRRDWDTSTRVLTFKLAAGDYAFVIAKILELDLTTINDQTASRALSKIEFLMVRFELRQPLSDLAEYISKFGPRGEPDFSRVGIQYGILGTIAALGAVDLAPQIAALLKPSTGRSLYREAISTLIKLHSREAVPALLSLLYDKEYTNRFYAIEGLAKLEAKSAAPQIARLLDDENANTRHLALDTLVKLDAHRSQTQAIRRFFEIATVAESRTLAAAALADAKAEGSAELVVRLVTDRDLHVRGEMINALVRLKARSIIPSLLNILNDDAVLGGDIGTDSNIRATIINGLRGLDAKEVIPILRGYLRGSNSFLAGVAAKAVGEFEAKEADSELVEIFNTPSQTRLINLQITPTTGLRQRSPWRRLAKGRTGKL